MTANDAHTAESMHRAFDALPVAVALVSDVATRQPGSERVAYLNPAFAELTGYSRTQFVGRTPLALVGPQAEPSVVKQWRSALAEGASFSAELLVSCRDERAVWMRISMQPFDLAPNTLVLTLEDISAHKSARASVRASEARLEMAIEAGALSLWDWNVSRDYVYYNDQWRSSIGVDPKELLKRETLHERLMLPEDAEVLDEFERHFRGGTSHFECEYELPTAYGKPKWFLARARVVARDEKGRAQRVIGVLRDISRRIQNQQEAEEVQQRWERAVDALGVPVHRMPSGAGHDAMKLHEIMPQAMLFVRGQNNGISHNPRESTTSDDIELAAQAMLGLLDALANETST